MGQRAFTIMSLRRLWGVAETLWSANAEANLLADIRDDMAELCGFIACPELESVNVHKISVEPSFWDHRTPETATEQLNLDFDTDTDTDSYDAKPLPSPARPGTQEFLEAAVERHKAWLVEKAGNAVKDATARRARRARYARHSITARRRILRSITKSLDRGGPLKVKQLTLD